MSETSNEDNEEFVKATDERVEESLNPFEKVMIERAVEKLEDKECDHVWLPSFWQTYGTRTIVEEVYCTKCREVSTLD